MQGICNKEVDKRKYHPKLDRDVTPLPGECWIDLLEWNGIPLKEGYQVSNLGRVRNLGRVIVQRNWQGKMIQHPYPACMLHQTPDPDGYLHVGLSRQDSAKALTPAAHRIVAATFLGPAQDLNQTQINHIDGNKNNNTVDNLEWCTPFENNKHARDTGLARLGTSQCIHGRVVEWDAIFTSKSKTDAALGRYCGYIDYCKQHNLPIIDKNTGNEVHVEWLEREENHEYYKSLYQ